MVIPKGRLSVSTTDGTVTTGLGEVVHTPRGEAVTIRSHETGAVTSYVTHPHWRAAAWLHGEGERPKTYVRHCLQNKSGQKVWSFDNVHE